MVKYLDSNSCTVTDSSCIAQRTNAPLGMLVAFQRPIGRSRLNTSDSGQYPRQVRSARLEKWEQ